MTFPDKYRVLLMIWLLQFVNYLDRINLAVAAPTMMKELSIGPNLFGFVLAAFTFGYAIAQIPGGALADRFGAKRMLIVSPVLWSLFTGATGFVSTVLALIVVRVLFGFCEGLSNGASFKSVGDYFPPQERSTANGVYLSSLALGPAFVAPVAVWFLIHTGWQGMFRWLTLPGLAMALLAVFLMPANRAPRDAAEPVAGAADTASEPASHSHGSFGAVMRMPRSWLIFTAYLAFNVAFWGYLGWMPSYLSMARHIDLKALGFAASVPYFAGTVGMFVFGWLGSTVLYRARCLLIAFIYLCTAACLYVTYNVDSAEHSIIGLSAAGFFLYGGFGPVWSVVLDLTPGTSRGAFSGFVNCGGQIGGFFAPIVVGWIVGRTASFTGGFIFMNFALAIAAVCFLLLHTVVRSRQSAALASGNAA
jgi:sugar phosphate permease